MTTFVALLRGINVGKAKRVPMAELRALLTGLGYTGVATLLNSGNVVFRAARGVAAKHAIRIADSISTGLDVEVAVIVKTAPELDRIISENPLAGSGVDDSRLLVAFVQETQSLKTLEAVGGSVVPPERFVVGKHAAYLTCPDGVLASKAGKALLGKVGQAATTRNWATVRKLQALAIQA